MESRNVVLIVLDSVRKDYFNKYSTKLESEADIDISKCYAASGWSAPSHASILTGELPHKHGVHSHSPNAGKIKKENTFLKYFPNTYGVSANPPASEVFGFDSVFDEFNSYSHLQVFSEGLNPRKLWDDSTTGPQKYSNFVHRAWNSGNFVKSVVNAAGAHFKDEISRLPVQRPFDFATTHVLDDSLKLDKEEPFFLFLNVMEAHGPHKLVKGYDYEDSVSTDWHSKTHDMWEINDSDDIEEYKDYLENFRQIYAAAVEYLDEKVAQFVNRLQNATEDNTTIIITADHGENLGYNGLLEHEGSLSNSLMHVPLIIINPPEMVSEPDLISHLDLKRIIQSISQGELRLPDRKLAPAEIAGAPHAPNHNKEYWDRAIRCVVEREKKFEWDSLGNKYEYSLNSDSKERLINQNIDIPSRMKDLFDDDIRSFKSKAEKDGKNWDISDTAMEQMEDLGYI